MLIDSFPQLKQIPQKERSLTQREEERGAWTVACAGERECIRLCVWVCERGIFQRLFRLVTRQTGPNFDEKGPNRRTNFIEDLTLMNF